ncbi:unnamed protein product [Caenorhabditis auriculariae]|uniref:SAM domain-containing protein n=1 Tax=Caenorhabditis auriculariae TaxID=2777116 RepID=A0A8S1H5Y6_9PELO|nr:unnamed protein product [Caenorhabditis auriculariae]
MADSQLDLSNREEALAAVERVVELLEDHFGWPERCKPPAGQPRLGPAPQFTFEIHGDEPDRWRYVMNSIRQEMTREEAAFREIRNRDLIHGRRKRSRLADWLSRKFGRRHGAPHSNVSSWSVDDVCSWLNSLGLSQYSPQFKNNDVQGNELIHLERGDFKDLGVNKIGHVKRLQSAIEELREKDNEKRRSSRHSNATTSANTTTTKPRGHFRDKAGSQDLGGPSKMRKGASLSVERRSSASAVTNSEQPSLNSL